MNTTFKPILTISLALLFFACEDEINPKLGSSKPILTVDAFINNKPENQQIKLSLSTSLFNNTSLPEGISGAEVFILDNENQRFDFIEIDKGVYEWAPSTGEVFGTVGGTYSLAINYNGINYSAQSTMGPVPNIDSVYFTYEEGIFGAEDFYQGDFSARDLPGEGNTYWFRTYKNGTLLNRPAEINIAYDAAFSPGGGGEQDGKPFIPPIRFLVNPTDDDGNFEEFPYVNGDSLYVEVHSITEATFNFLTQLAVQSNRPGGIAELFAEPLNNVSTNITSSQNEEVIGFFNVAAVKGNGRRLITSEVPIE